MQKKTAALRAAVFFAILEKMGVSTTGLSGRVLKTDGLQRNFQGPRSKQFNILSEKNRDYDLWPFSQNHARHHNKDLCYVSDSFVSERLQFGH